MAFKVVRGLCKPKVHFIEPSLTRQEFAASADMNYIVSKFLRTGQVDLPNAGRPMVDGLEFPNDFTEACNLAFEHRHEEIVKQHELDFEQVQEGSLQVSSESAVSAEQKAGEGKSDKVESSN